MNRRGLRCAGRRSKQFNEAVAKHDNGKMCGLLSFYVSDNLESPHCHHEFFISSIPAQVEAAEMPPGYAVEYRFQLQQISFANILASTR